MPLICSIDACKPNRPIYSGHLRLGGSNPRGDTIGITNAYLTRNGRLFFVVSGEFHYSRYPEAYWEEELLKVKAGGVNTVATYLFWSLHEEKQGVFDWTGQKNLRRFVELCARHDLLAVLRIGPFVHGEWRNGSLLFKQGGPIVAIQIENEYVHAGAPWEASRASRCRAWRERVHIPLQFLLKGRPG